MITLYNDIRPNPSHGIDHFQLSRQMMITSDEIALYDSFSSLRLKKELRLFVSTSYDGHTL